MATLKYKVIVEELRNQIRIMHNNEKIESLQNLKKRFNCSIGTILKSIKILEKEGKMVSIQGSGFYVSKKEGKIKPDIYSSQIDFSMKSFINHQKPVLKFHVLDENLDWQLKYWSEIAREFEKEKNVDVEIVSWGKNLDNPIEQVDVVIVNHCSLPEFVYTNPLLNLKPYIEDKEKNLDFFPNIWRAGMFNGKLVGVPVFFTLPITVHNMNLWNKIGKEPSDFLTWEEYIELLNYAKKKILMKENNIHFVFSHIASFIHLLINGIELFDKDEIKIIDNRKTKEKVQEILEKLCILKEIEPLYYSIDYEDCVKYFIKGKVFSFETGTGFQYFKNGNFKVTTLPLNHNFIFPTTVMVSTVLAEGKEIVLGGEFASFLVSEKAQKIFAKYNRLPLYRSIADSSYYQPPKWQNKNLFIKISEKSIPIEIRHRVLWKFLFSIFDFEVKRLLKERRNIEEVVDNIFTRGKIYIKDIVELDKFGIKRRGDGKN